MGFEGVIGQEDVRSRLIAMVEEQRLPHALLFCGPKGCGKMAMALSFAAYLLTKDATSPNAEAMVRTWQHPDLHFSYPVIRPAGTSAEHKMTSDDFAEEWNRMLSQGIYFSLEQWLEQMRAANQQAIIGVGESDNLIRKLSLKASQGLYKISIIWLPERMNGECANKLLKIIEEPPQQTTFIMVCETPEQLLETIKSRTQRIDFKGIEMSAIEKALIEKRGIPEEAARRIARIANGNWLKALQELNTDNENRLFLSMFIMLMRLAYQRNIKELKSWSETVAGYGRERQRGMLTYFLHLIRENFMYNFQIRDLSYMTEEEENFSKNFSRFIHEGNVMEITELLSRAIRDIGQNANGKIVFFDLVLKMIVLLRQR